MADEQVTVRIVIDASKAREGQAEVERSLKSIDDRISAIQTSFGTLGELMTKGGMIAAIGMIASRIGEVASQAYNSAKKLDDLAESAGLTTRKFQGLEYAWAQSGAAGDKLGSFIGTFKGKIDGAASGNADLIKTFNALGVSILNTAGNVKPLEEQLLNTATAIMKIDDPAKRSQAAIALFGDGSSRTIEVIGKLTGGLRGLAQEADNAGAMIDGGMTARLRELENRSVAAGQKFDKLIGSITVQFTVPALEGLNRVLASTARELDLIKRGFEWLTSGPSLDTLNSQAKDLQGTIDAISSGKTPLSKERLPGLYKQLDEVNKKIADKMTADYTPTLPPITVTGGSNPSAIGTGDDTDDRINKRIQLLEAEAKSTEKQAAAALQGASGVRELEASFTAMQQALQAYGAKAEASDPKVQALAASFGKLNQQISDNRALSAFRLQTGDVSNQNDILQKRLDLLGEAPAIVAREVAILQVRNDIAKSGAKISDEDVQARTAAVEKQELLNQKLQESQRAQELWLQPIKSALSSMQQGLAGMFEQLFTGGINSWQAFVDSMKRVWIRMLADLAAVSVIRPLIAPIIAGGASLGVVSPGVASQLGYGSGAGGLGGGLFGGGLFGGGGLSSGGSSTGGDTGWFGNIGTSIGNWWNSPIAFGSSLSSGSSPASQAVPHGSVDAMFGGTTWGQGISALAGAGMGIYQLATAGGSTGKTIGGIASLVGAGVSLIPGIGQVAGPIISMLGGLLPGLFGGDNQEPPTMRGIGTVNFTGGNFTTTGSGYGGGSAVNLTPVGNSITAMLKGAGVNLGALSGRYGIQQQTYSKGDFSNATTLVNGLQWGMGSNEKDVGLDTATAHVAHQMMMEVGSGISDIMRQGLANYGLANLQHAFSTQELAQAVSELQSFEATMKTLGKTTSTAETALQQIDSQFAGLYDTANRYGLDTSQLDVNKASQRTKVGQDFVKSLDRQLDPVAAAKQDVEDERQALIDSNKYLLANLAGYQDQIVKIEQVAAQKRVKVAEQMLNGLDSAIKRLTYGDLSNLGDTATLSGTRAAFMATVAQARAGNADAQGRVASEGTNLAQLSQRYYASSPEYEAQRQQILAIFRELQIAAGGGDVTTGTAANAASNAMVQAQSQQIEQLTALVGDLARQNQDLNAKLTQVTDLLQRTATNR